MIFIHNIPMEVFMRKKRSPLSIGISLVFMLFWTSAFIGNRRFSITALIGIIAIVSLVFQLVKSIKSSEVESEDKDVRRVEKNLNTGANRELKQYESQSKQENKEERMFNRERFEREDSDVRAQESQKVQMVTRFCPHCDEQLKKNYRKCPSCGEKI